MIVCIYHLHVAYLIHVASVSLLLWQKFCDAVGLCRTDKMKNKIAQMLRQVSYSLIRKGK